MEYLAPLRVTLSNACERCQVETVDGILVQLLVSLKSASQPIKPSLEHTMIPSTLTPIRAHTPPSTSPPLVSNALCSLCNNSASSRTLILPRRRQRAHGLVVPRQAVDPGLDEDEAEFAVLVLAVALEVLADGDGLAPQ